MPAKLVPSNISLAAQEVGESLGRAPVVVPEQDNALESALVIGAGAALSLTGNPMLGVPMMAFGAGNALSDTMGAAASSAALKRFAAFRKLAPRSLQSEEDQVLLSQEQFDFLYGHTGLRYNPDNPLTAGEADMEAAAAVYDRVLDRAQQHGNASGLARFVGTIVAETLLDPSAYASFAAGKFVGGVSKGLSLSIASERALAAGGAVADVGLGLVSEKIMTEATGQREFTLDDAAMAVGIAGGFYGLGFLATKYTAARKVAADAIDAGESVSVDDLDIINDNLDSFQAPGGQGFDTVAMFDDVEVNGEVTPSQLHRANIDKAQEVLEPDMFKPRTIETDAGPITFPDKPSELLHRISVGDPKAAPELEKLLYRIGAVDEATPKATVREIIHNAAKSYDVPEAMAARVVPQDDTLKQLIDAPVENVVLPSDPVARAMYKLRSASDADAALLWKYIKDEMGVTLSEAKKIAKRADEVFNKAEAHAAAKTAGYEKVRVERRTRKVTQTISKIKDDAAKMYLARTLGLSADGSQASLKKFAQSVLKKLENLVETRLHVATMDELEAIDGALVEVLGDTASRRTNKLRNAVRKRIEYLKDVSRRYADDWASTTPAEWKLLSLLESRPPEKVDVSKIDLKALGAPPSKVKGALFDVDALGAPGALEGPQWGGKPGIAGYDAIIEGLRKYSDEGQVSDPRGVQVKQAVSKVDENAPATVRSGRGVGANYGDAAELVENLKSKASSPEVAATLDAAVEDFNGIWAAIHACNKE